MGLGNLGNLGNLDIGQLQGYLQGVNFPAARRGCLQRGGQQRPAGAGRADKELGNENFNSADEVLQQVQGGQ
jgi:hypothetical protein